MVWKFRTALFWTHLAIGTVAGLFILNMAGSGILIAYQKQITALVERSQRTVVAPAGAKPFDVETLVAKVQAARPDAHLSGVVLYSDPNAAAMFYVGRENNVLYANPYTGEVVGEGQKTVRGFFQAVTSWHRWLALEGTARPIGQAITGTLSIAYFALLFSGLILWLPRQWSRSRLRQGSLLDLKLRGRASNWNWHNVVGLWFAPLLLLVTLTGIIMSHDWAGDLLFRLTGNPVPAHRSEGGRSGGRDAGGPAEAPDLSGINPLWAQAEKQVSSWHSISLRFPRSEDAPVMFLIDQGDGSRPNTVAQLALDRDTGEVLHWQPYATENAGQKLRSWMRPIHTGEAGGVLGQSIAVVAALGGITLAWTGLSMACRPILRRPKPGVSSISQNSNRPYLLNVMIEIFLKGGPVMWPLLATSIVTLGVVIDRLWFIFQERRSRQPQVVDNILQCLEAGLTDNAVEAGKDSTDFVARTLTYALTHRDTSLSQAILRIANLELKRFSRGLPVLDTVITLAPLLGLLGTVTGMIHSFNLLGNTELSAPTAITGGIAQALIATAFGLGIAIAALIPFNYLNARQEEARHEIEDATSQLELLLVKCSGGNCALRAMEQVVA